MRITFITEKAKGGHGNKIGNQKIAPGACQNHIFLMIALSPSHPLFDIEQVIFLSPHCDDVCFSIGGIAQQFHRGILLNLYTRSTYVHPTSPLCPNESLTSNFISQARTQEDERFAKACGLTRMDLGLEEPELMGQEPFCYDNLLLDIELLEDKLITRLKSLAQRNDPKALLFCPMGIGHHRNHLATTLTILKNRTSLEQYYQLFFYFDLPYAADQRHKMHGIKRFEQIVKSANLPIYMYELTSKRMENKQALIELYQSQLPASINLNEYGVQEIGQKKLYETFIELHAQSARSI